MPNKRPLVLVLAALPLLACAGEKAGAGTGQRPCAEPTTCPCSADSDCPASLRCVEWDAAAVCVPTCGAGCDDDLRCVALPRVGGGLELGCLPRARELCAACDTDEQCGGPDDHCVAVDDGTSCARACDDEECPVGYACGDTVSAGGRTSRQCLPATGTCRCRTGDAGFVRTCLLENPYGACPGIERCEGDGAWSPCNAEPPRQEICNGADDDCDGLVDVVDPTLAPPTPAPDFPACSNGPACEGTWVCGVLPDEGTGWACTAPSGGAELCNGLDDDCDGKADNGFLDASLRYVHVEHCGSCNHSCTAGISHLATDSGAVAPGAVSCETTPGAPTCVVHACETGFVPFPPSAPRVCLPLAATACAACNSPLDCGAPSDACLRVGSDEISTCALDCSASSPRAGCTGELGAQQCCPAGFTCTAVQEASLCLPDTGTCQCDAGGVGIERSCVALGAGRTTCLGLQNCVELSPGDYAWTTCDASSLATELCNQQDDDCDGDVDEDFLAQNGTDTYDTDAHCGACNNNCPNRWNAAAHHVVGYCAPLPSPRCTFDDDDCLIAAGPGGTPCDVGCSGAQTCLTRATPGVQYDYFQCGVTCSQDSDCGAGSSCLAGACSKNCSVGATGDTACRAAQGALASCVATAGGGRCQVQYQWKNLDERAVTGCECPAALAAGPDEPQAFVAAPTGDELYLDTNCDGVDGEVAKAVFVSATSPEPRDGTRNHPWRTLAEGLAALRADPSKSYVLVATGLYKENVRLAPGDRIYGGYAPDFRARDVTKFLTTVSGVEPDWSSATHELGTINARCDAPTWTSSSLTEVSGFTIRGYDVTYTPGLGEPGESAYAIYVRDCGAFLRLTANRVLSGRGGPAGPSKDGSIGASGGDGQPGLDARPCCDSGECRNCGGTLSGGAGGTNGVCANTNGQDGDTSTATDTKRGTYNCSAAYCTLNCRYDCTTTSTSNGANGASGAAGGTPLGSGGDGCGAAASSITLGEWSGGTGAGGLAGTAGSPGAGGQAGPWVGYGTHSNPTGCQPSDLYNRGDFGGTGGGGGAAGCGGGGGTGGASGGGSFGVFVVLSAPGPYPVIRGNVIERGIGGEGGAGGAGGQGGSGGLGGLGGDARDPSWCAGLGGAGGAGGQGGSGGGGGGGCGGAAYAIAGSNIAAAGYLANNLVSAAGGGGAGGSGGGSAMGGDANGKPGAPGAAGDFISFP